MRVYGVSLACLALTATVFADDQRASQPDILNRVMKKTWVQEKSLPEVVALMSEASGVSVKLAPEIQTCIDAKKRGCDWVISTDWGGQPLSDALYTLTASAGLAYRVVNGDTVLLTRRTAAHP